MALRVSRRTGGAIMVAAALLAGPALASQIAVTTYDMPNGDGNAHGGSYNYWDAGYSNCVANNCTTDGLSGSTLSGGAGKLTDGVISTNPWYLVSNQQGTGEYVGWLYNSPTITFHFASSQTVKEIRLYVDNSHVGGVTAPDSVIVNGTSFGNPAWASASAPEFIDITGLSFTGNSISVQLHDPTYWVFLSEAQFFGASGVPEAGTWMMMTTGLFGLGAMARRRRHKLAPAKI